MLSYGMIRPWSVKSWLLLRLNTYIWQNSNEGHSSQNAVPDTWKQHNEYDEYM